MIAVAPSSLAPSRLEEIRALLNGTDFKDAELYPLAGDASFRRYIRVHKGTDSAMLMDAPPDKEDVRPFVAIAEYLYKNGYSAPRIIAGNVPAGLLLLEDFGDDSFSSVLKRDSGLEKDLYGSAIDLLAQWHREDKKFSNPGALVLPTYNDVMLLKEISLFTDWYLPQIVGKEKAALLRPEYLDIWRDIFSKAQLTDNVWVHRDYHADNLMWLPKRANVKRVGLLDFQDGVYGDAAYDLASLLEDARRDVPKPLMDSMLERYISAAGVDRESFLESYAILGAQRNSKIIGIFSRLATRDNKISYLNFLPRVWRHLENDLAHPALEKLKLWLDKNVSKQNRGIINIKVKD